MPLFFGAIVVPRGSDVNADDVAHICAQANCRIVFAGTEAVAALVVDSPLELSCIAIFPGNTGINSPQVIDTVPSILANQAAIEDTVVAQVEERLQAVQPGDLATIIYFLDDWHPEGGTVYPCRFNHAVAASGRCAGSGWTRGSVALLVACLAYFRINRDAVCGAPGGVLIFHNAASFIR